MLCLNVTSVFASEVNPSETIEGNTELISEVKVSANSELLSNNNTEIADSEVERKSEVLIVESGENEMYEEPEFSVEKNSSNKVTINDYNGNKGETLTQYFENGVKTSAFLTDSSGKRIRSWSYYSNGNIRMSYYWNGNVKITGTEYDSKGVKLTSYKYHKNNEPKEIINYYSNGKKKLERSFDINGYKLSHIEYLSSGYKKVSFTYYANTNKVFRRQEFVDNELVETQERYGDGIKVKYIWTYQTNGNVNRKISFNTSGYRTKTEERYSNGSTNKYVWTYYSGADKVKQKVSYSSKDVRTKTEERTELGKIKYIWTYYSGGDVVKTKEFYNKNGIKQYTNKYNNKGGLVARESFEEWGSPLKPVSYTTCSYGNSCYTGHTGVDFVGKGSNPAIYTVASGRVVETGYDANGYGNYIVVDHDNGYFTLYAHLSSKSNFTNGQFVIKGDKIGNQGSTGNSTGPHLHFEVRKGGNHISNNVNPFGSGKLDKNDYPTAWSRLGEEVMENYDDALMLGNELSSYDYPAVYEWEE